MGHRSSSTTRPGRSRWRARHVEAHAMPRALVHRGGGGSAVRSGWPRLVASPGRLAVARERRTVRRNPPGEGSTQGRLRIRRRLGTLAVVVILAVSLLVYGAWAAGASAIGSGTSTRPGSWSRSRSSWPPTSASWCCSGCSSTASPAVTRALAWTEQASGALLPGGGAGGLAIGGWLIHLAGAPTHWIVRRSSGIFFLTSAVNSATVIGAGLALTCWASGPTTSRARGCRRGSPSPPRCWSPRCRCSYALDVGSRGGSVESAVVLRMPSRRRSVASQLAAGGRARLPGLRHGGAVDRAQSARTRAKRPGADPRLQHRLHGEHAANPRWDWRTRRRPDRGARPSMASHPRTPPRR
jgi:hypothetical protein